MVPALQELRTPVRVQTPNCNKQSFKKKSAMTIVGEISARQLAKFGKSFCQFLKIQLLQNACVLAQFGADTAENKPIVAEIWLR